MIDELATAYPVIVGNEAYATHASWLAERPDDYQPLIRERLLSFAGRPAKDYIDAQRLRRRLVPEFRAAVEGVDVLVTATTRLRATPIGQAEVDGVQVRPALLALNAAVQPVGLARGVRPGADGHTDGLPVGVQIVGRAAGGARHPAGGGGDRVGAPLTPSSAPARMQRKRRWVQSMH